MELNTKEKISSVAANVKSAFSQADLKKLIRSKPLIIGVFSLTSIAVAFGGYLMVSPEKSTDKNLLTPSVQALRVQKQALESIIAAPGTITFMEKAAVNSKIQGRVEKIFVDVGMKVKKGQKLAQMEKFELQIKLRQTRAALNNSGSQRDLAKARYRAARRNVGKQMVAFERQQSDIISAKAAYLNSKQTLMNKKELFEVGGTSKLELKSAYSDYVSSMSRYFQSRKDYKSAVVGFRNSDLKKVGRKVSKDKSKRKESIIDINTEVERTEVKVAKSNLGSARLELQNIKLLLKESAISSPLTGVVASRGIENGEEIKQGEPLFTIVRMDKLLVSTNVSEKDLRRVKEGQVVTIKVDAIGGLEIKGVVHLISPVIDVKTRTAEVKVIVDNSKRTLNPGMFVRCRIKTSVKKDALAVQDSAILNRVEKKGAVHGEVFVIQNKLAFKRSVVLGETFGDQVEILSGLKHGDLVVTSRVQLLKDGSPVTVSNPEQLKDKQKKAPLGKKIEKISAEKRIQSKRGQK